MKNKKLKHGIKLAMASATFISSTRVHAIDLNTKTQNADKSYFNTISSPYKFDKGTFFTFDYSQTSNPLVLKRADGSVAPLIKGLNVFEMSFLVGMTDWLQLGILVPGENPHGIVGPYSSAKQYLNNILIEPKIYLMDGVALIPIYYLPSSSTVETQAKDFDGSDLKSGKEKGAYGAKLSVGFGDPKKQEVLTAFQIGAIIAPESKFREIDQTNRFQLNAGMSVPLSGTLRLLVEAYIEKTKNNTPFESIAAIEYRNDNFMLRVGGGKELQSSGSNDSRVLANFTYYFGQKKAEAPTAPLKNLDDIELDERFKPHNPDQNNKQNDPILEQSSPITAKGDALGQTFAVNELIVKPRSVPVEKSEVPNQNPASKEPTAQDIFIYAERRKTKEDFLITGEDEEKKHKRTPASIDLEDMDESSLEKRANANLTQAIQLMDYNLFLYKMAQGSNDVAAMSEIKKELSWGLRVYYKNTDTLKKLGKTFSLETQLELAEKVVNDQSVEFSPDVVMMANVENKLNVRSLPKVKRNNIIKRLNKLDKVVVLGKAIYGEFVQVHVLGSKPYSPLFVSKNFLIDEKDLSSTLPGVMAKKEEDFVKDQSPEVKISAKFPEENIAADDNQLVIEKLTAEDKKEIESTLAQLKDLFEEKHQSRLAMDQELDKKEALRQEEVALEKKLHQEAQSLKLAEEQKKVKLLEEKALADKKAQEELALKVAHEAKLKEDERVAKEKADAQKRLDEEKQALLKEQEEQIKAQKLADEQKEKILQEEAIALAKKQEQEALDKKLAEEKIQKDLEEARIALAQQKEQELLAQKLAEDKRQKEIQDQKLAEAKNKLQEALELKQAEERNLQLAKEEQALAQKKAQEELANKLAEEARQKKSEEDRLALVKKQEQEDLAKKLSEEKIQKENEQQRLALIKQQEKEALDKKLAEEKLQRQAQAEELALVKKQEQESLAKKAAEEKRIKEEQALIAKQKLQEEERLRLEEQAKIEAEKIAIAERKASIVIPKVEKIELLKPALGTNSEVVDNSSLQEPALLKPLPITKEVEGPVQELVPETVSSTPVMEKESSLADTLLKEEVRSSASAEKVYKKISSDSKELPKKGQVLNPSKDQEESKINISEVFPTSTKVEVVEVKEVTPTKVEVEAVKTVETKAEVEVIQVAPDAPRVEVKTVETKVEVIDPGSIEKMEEKITDKLSVESMVVTPDVKQTEVTTVIEVKPVDAKLSNEELMKRQIEQLMLEKKQLEDELIAQKEAEQKAEAERLQAIKELEMKKIEELANKKEKPTSILVEQSESDKIEVVSDEPADVPQESSPEPKKKKTSGLFEEDPMEVQNGPKFDGL